MTSKRTPRHFLTLDDCTITELHGLISRGIEMKRDLAAIRKAEPFKNYVLGMLFEKASTRTRVSFESGMVQLGGHAMFINSEHTQLARGEPIEDNARVLSSMVDIIMIRTFGHNLIEEFARYSSVPVINGLTDDHHPCQILADIQTFIEHRGSIQGKKVAWIGDGNNVCQSYVEAARLFDFQLSIACPVGFEPYDHMMEKSEGHITVVRRPEEAAEGAHLLTTDVWASMGQESEKAQRKKVFANYQINERLMELASPDAVFLHCLPAHRGEEISEGMLNHPQSLVWEQAENRMHVQKALIEFLLTHPR